MVRKSQKAAKVAFENISEEVAASIVLATSGKVKGKDVDPRKQIGTIHIKKFLAIERINRQYERWIALLSKIEAASKEGSEYVMTAEDVALYENCKRETSQYLEEHGSQALKNKVANAESEVVQMKSISSSMKYKFSVHSFEVITHAINLMVRELLVFTCDNCLSKGCKLTKRDHIPWSALQPKLFSGLYMNTRIVHDTIHGVEDESSEELTEEPSTEEPVEETDEAVEDAEEAVEEAEEAADTTDDAKPARRPRAKLTQYIGNAFKEITSREERFNKVLLGQEVISLVNDLVYQSLDRYSKVIESLMKVTESKTITAKIALIATGILLRDDINTSEEDVKVVGDILHQRLEEIIESKSATEETSSEEPTESVVEPVAEPTPAPVIATKTTKGRAKKATAQTPDIQYIFFLA